MNGSSAPSSGSPTSAPADAPAMPLVIAHRGASADRRENTLEAFVEAEAQGADGVELDVRLTSDEQLVLAHDPRLGDGTLIRSTTASGLREIEPLETLPDALGVAPGIVNVEVKSDEPAEHLARRMKVLELVLSDLARRPAGGRYVVSTFDLDILALLASMGCEWPTAYLTMGVPKPELAMDVAASMGCTAYNPWHPEVDRALVDGAHDRGLEVWTWTVNGLDAAVGLARLGVDALITDHPAAMRAHLADAGFVARDPADEAAAARG
ncbi:MAG: glycerophosphodiester phosphodiesterase [Microthrixaceae bacterium]